MIKYNCLIFLFFSCIPLTFTSAQAAQAAHAHHKLQSQTDSTTTCTQEEITCAKTVTASFAPNGDLWRLWSHNDSLYFQISRDKGVTFSTVRRVPIAKESISARNENRPKIAFDQYQGVYLSWAMPKAKKYTADIRFAYSKDYGTSFTKPITVNNDKLETGHSFNEMQVSDEGEISLVWLDARLAHQARSQGKQTNGSALYLGKANYRKQQPTFTNQALANSTCVCCRIALDTSSQGELAILWRHIYGDNIREFALLTLAQDENTPLTPYQISHDHWQIDGCPHQGGGLSIDKHNRYHMVWFNQGDLGKGIFYASSLDQGKTLTKPVSIGEQSAQAAHPHIDTLGNKVNIVWTQFNGIEHQLWHQYSDDNGQSFSQPKLLTTATAGADRPFIITNNKMSFVSWHRLKQSHWIQAL
ncbi:glycoside hydrolase [Shewanella sp. D64]|uniref:sialidase family protein n=1 Tax=unclassified Shewanella TaxID=196818 RepID=UPI0022BA6882|nr:MULTISPECIES: sialidase family protein [unclassified Shewanella]MEC4725167.1 glycoside hydrolase [Shewanella sp. D64]MEC4737068.1 glycoside hydrolase [Shewanella sp. E94]WBJ96653.1 glycoside hydrolase [Shewanella sp. MTB7]